MVAFPAELPDSLAGEWDTRWTSPGIDQEVLALSSRPDGTLIVGGRFGGNVGSPKHLAAWKQDTWSTVPKTDPDGVPDPVFAAVTIGTNTFLGGEFGGSSAGVILNGLARWDGQALHPLGAGPLAGVQGQVYALAAAGETLYAAGRFRRAGSVAATNIVRWDGATWTPLGSGLGDGDNDRVSTLLIAPDGTLYAGGTFQQAGAQPVRRLARWDGTAWADVGGGANGPVQALAWFGGELIAGGAFTVAGTTNSANLARWNGTRWSALGAGVNGEVNALAPQGNRLLAGGCVCHGRRDFRGRCGGVDGFRLGGARERFERRQSQRGPDAGGAGRCRVRRRQLHPGRRHHRVQRGPLGWFGLAVARRLPGRRRAAPGHRGRGERG